MAPSSNSKKAPGVHKRVGRVVGGGFHLAIVGGSGSGKTWLAERLCACLGPNARHVSLDDFYRDLSHLDPSQRAAANFDEPAAIDWAAVGETMDGLSRGEPAQVPIYDFATHTRRSQGKVLEPGKVLIWDGLWLLQPEWLRARFGFSVFVDCPADERLARRIQRDVRQRGRTADSVRAQFAGQVQPMHERFVEPQRGWATQCVSSPVSSGTFESLLKDVTAAMRRLEAERAPA